MTAVHPHAPGHEHAPGFWQAEWTAPAPALLAAVLYLVAARRLRRRGDAWSPWRDIAFTGGAAGIAVAALGAASGGTFTAHMAQHLVIGMAGPLLLVLGRPLTLLLRALPPGRARRAVVAVAQSPPLTVLLFPPVAAVLDVGGLWLLYRTGLFAATHDRPWLHILVHVHVLAAGLLFTAAICQLEPTRHRYSLVLRGTTLVGASAAHAVLAKTLWGTPPPGTGFAAGDLQAGAELMYYGGDVVEIGLALVIALRWYAATGRKRLHERKRDLRPTRMGTSDL